MASATPWLKSPFSKWVWCWSCDHCLNFNPFNISGGMRWGEAGGMQATMLRRITSLLLNNAWIYWDDAILESCFAVPCCRILCNKIITDCVVADVQQCKRSVEKMPKSIKSCWDDEFLSVFVMYFSWFLFAIFLMWMRFPHECVKVGFTFKSWYLPNWNDI